MHNPVGAPGLPVRFAALWVLALLAVTTVTSNPAIAVEPAVDPVDVVVVKDTPDGPSVETVPAGSAAEAERLAEQLEGRPDVIAAEPSRDWQAYQDPYRGLQWGMDHLRAETVWRTADGTGFTIAVLDTGVDRLHEDLQGVVLPGYDFLRGVADGGVDPCPATTEPCLGHGTGVAGVAAAVAGNDIGIAGFAKGVRILPVRVLDERGNGRTEHVVKGIYYAVDRGAHVINLSLGGPYNDRTITRAIDYASDRGVLVVAAVGNTARSEPNYPAAHPRVLGVSATKNANNERTTFSSYGDWVDIAAPGERIFTTRPRAAAPNREPYVYQSGTSFSAPFVSGAAVMLKARYPRATPSQLAWRLTATATDIGAAGKDRYFGHGLVNPLRALTSFRDAGCRPDVGEPLPRVWDRARVETAAAVACELWPEARTRTVLLATAGHFPDALAGAALAARHDAPLLLTAPGRLSPPAAEMIHQLGANRAILLGGTAALATQIETDLRGLGVERIDRLAGTNRYATASMSARSAKPQGAREVVLASGTGFADALSAGALVATPDRLPVLLTDPHTLPAVTVDALERLGTESVLILGGPTAVSSRVVAELRGMGMEVRRLAGDDRYGTSVKAAREALGRMAGTRPLLFASGAAFPDALAGGAAAARMNAPLLLVPPKHLPNRPVIEEFLREAPWDGGLVIGGQAAVGEDVRAHLTAASQR
jgi:thermitase